MLLIVVDMGSTLPNSKGGQAVGEVILTIRDREGVVRTQLKAVDARTEKQSLRLYRQLRPFISAINDRHRKAEAEGQR